MLFKYTITLLIFCLDVLSIIQCELLKSPTIIVLPFLPLVLSMFALHIRCSDIGYICIYTYIHVYVYIYIYVYTVVPSYLQDQEDAYNFRQNQTPHMFFSIHKFL